MSWWPIVGPYKIFLMRISRKRLKSSDKKHLTLQQFENYLAMKICWRRIHTDAHNRFNVNTVAKMRNAWIFCSTLLRLVPLVNVKTRNVPNISVDFTLFYTCSAMHVIWLSRCTYWKQGFRMYHLSTIWIFWLQKLSFVSKIFRAHCCLDTIYVPNKKRKIMSQIEIYVI